MRATTRGRLRIALSPEIKLLDIADSRYPASNTPPQGEVCIRGPLILNGHLRSFDRPGFPSDFLISPNNVTLPTIRRPVRNHSGGHYYMLYRHQNRFRDNDEALLLVRRFRIPLVVVPRTPLPKLPKLHRNSWRLQIESSSMLALRSVCNIPVPFTCYHRPSIPKLRKVLGFTGKHEGRGLPWEEFDYDEWNFSKRMQSLLSHSCLTPEGSFTNLNPKKWVRYWFDIQGKRYGHHRSHWSRTTRWIHKWHSEQHYGPCLTNFFCFFGWTIRRASGISPACGRSSLCAVSSTFTSSIIALPIPISSSSFTYPTVTSTSLKHSLPVFYRHFRSRPLNGLNSQPRKSSPWHARWMILNLPPGTIASRHFPSDVLVEVNASPIHTFQIFLDGHTFALSVFLIKTLSFTMLLCSVDFPATAIMVANTPLNMCDLSSFSHTLTLTNASMILPPKDSAKLGTWPLQANVSLMQACYPLIPDALPFLLLYNSYMKQK